MIDATTERLMHALLFEVFGERDPERRGEAIRRTFADGAVFSDHDGSVRGHDAIHARAQEILDGAGEGLVFARDGEFQVLGDMGYQAWVLGSSEGMAVVRGADMGFARDGLLERVYTVVFS